MNEIRKTENQETVKNPAASCGASSNEKAIMGATAPKPPLAIPPHSKLWGFLAFSHEYLLIHNEVSSKGIYDAF